MTTRLLFTAIFSFLSFFSVAYAQNAVPDHRYVYSRDVDFYGADLSPLFETTQQACTRVCSANAACVAFTFNARSNACFPKSAVSERQPYEGAFSAERIATDQDVLAAAASRAADLDFLRPQDIEAAHDLARDFGARFVVNGRSTETLMNAATRAFSSNNRTLGMRWMGAALALSDRADLWESWAYHGLRLKSSDPSDFRRRARREALPAAINAYLRADHPGAQAASLQGLAEALERANRGRDMIKALRLAYDIQPRDDISAELDKAIAKYGFRIVEHKVDNNAASPRICAEFSQDLVQSGVDYEPFVRSGAQGLVVAADGRQLCLDGVTHGGRYQVTFRTGLPAASGDTLTRDVTLDLYVRDRAPSLRFAGRSYVLPRSADAALPIETVNMTQVDLTLRRVSDRNLIRAIQQSYFGRPMTYYDTKDFAGSIATQIWKGAATVQNTLNADMTTRLPLGEALADQPPGIYVLSAVEPDVDGYDAATASQWFVLTDLGLSTWQGTDGLTVAARALSDAGAQEGVKLTLISRANAVLGSVVTDADGFARFDAGLTRGTGASAPALLVAERGTDDLAFLPLTDPAFDLSDRGVEGRPPAPPIDTFLTTDRGAYRPGDTVNVTVLARDAQAKAILGLPLTAILTRPDGVEYSRTLSQNAQSGGHVFSLPLGANVPRGAWRLDLRADSEAKALATQTVLVEDFLPERIDFTLRLPNAALRQTDSAPLRIDARYLFGAAGADLAVEGEVKLRRRASLEAFPGYSFGRHDAAFSARTKYLDPARTDADGRAVMALDLPQNDTNGLLVEAHTTVRVSEGSGRPVERTLTTPIAPSGPMIGINPAFDDVLSEFATASFEVIATQGTLPVKWTVNRVETRYQWYRLYGNWNWEPTTRRTRVSSGEGVLGQNPLKIQADTEWGDYELVVETVGGQGGGAYIASSVSFSAGWYGGTDASETPDRLEMSLDAPSYDVGDTAKLRIVPRYAGTALVTVASNRVIERKVVAVRKGENTIPLEINADWGAGAYVTASVIRPMDVAAGQNPARSLGVVHASITPQEKALRVAIETPEVIDGQAGTFEATVRVKGIAAGETAHLTLAAVDVGILNLTGFKAPDPMGHYFGQRRLGVSLRDVYGRLIDGMNGAMGTVRSGGDAGAQAGLQSPPPTEALMSAFSGPVTVGADGTATVTIARPPFNGTIRLMAVVWTPTAVGQAVAETVARDPVVLTAALPRFLAPGDTSRMLLDFVHASGPAGEMQLRVEGDGVRLGTVPVAFGMAPNAAQRISVDLIGQDIGDHEITVALTTPDGTVLRKSLALGVRVTDPETATTRRFSMGAGDVFTFDDNVLAGMRRGTGRATLAAGPLARFDVPGLLTQLDRYPYGCTEQVTSAALPLLYLSDFAPQSGITDLPKRINGAIAQVLTRQASNGAFGLWRAQSGEFWLDTYVTDFLTRARAAGYAVPDTAFDLAIANLKNRVNYAPDFDNGGQDIAYALLVLARNGAARMGDLRYYADTKGGDFGTPLATAQLGGALAMYGDQLRADRMFARAAFQLARSQPDAATWRADFGTPLRDAAAVLKLAAEAGSAAIDRQAVATRISSTRRGLSTQEAAQVLMAAHALGRDTSNPGLTVNDVPASGPVIETLEAGGMSRAIRNVSGNRMDVTLTTYGVPVVAGAAGGYGYDIVRDYFTLDGDLAEGPFKVGERRVVVLTVQPFETVGARLIIDDALPAGLEIDNPNLIRAGDVRALDWLKPKATQSAEFRAERFIAAVDHRGKKPFALAYIVRAISPGDYHHPAALVQDMYRPEYRAVTATGRMSVTE